MPESTVLHPAAYPSPVAPRGPEILPIHEPTAAGQLAQIADVLERFHHDAHPGPLRFCYERPCQEIGGIMRGVIHQ